MPPLQRGQGPVLCGVIRRATTDDISLIRQMAEQAFPLTYRDILTPEQIVYMMDMMYSESSLMHQMTDGNNIFYISEGRGYVSFRHAGRTQDGRDLFHLEKLYVLPECQGRGTGRELFNTVVRAAGEITSGSMRIELNVNRYNRAVSFYEHIGMHRDRQGDFPIGSGYWMNDYIMAVDL